jgi:hypothetical protein
MINLEEYLFNRVKPVIESWGEKDIYAISFFVYSNEEFKYQGNQNVSEFSIGYNTEKDCNDAPQGSEERWNFAYWRHDMIPIIEPSNDNEGIKILFDWYKENGIENIGYEDYETCYDEKMNYIGKGPIGYYELLCVVSNVAKRIQIENVVNKKFGKRIPISVHDLEYPWYIEQATENANPNGEAVFFLTALRSGYSEKIKYLYEHNINSI